MGRRPKSSPSNKKSNDILGDIVIEGDYPDVDRFSTGLYSLDKAVGDGFPKRTAVEVYGYNGSAKSSLTYYLAAKSAMNSGGVIDIADFDGLSKTYLASAVRAGGYKGRVRLVPITLTKGKEVVPASAEKMFEELIKRFSSEESGVSVLDSVSMVVPESEQGGRREFGEGRVAIRAKLLAEFMRAVKSWLQSKSRPSNVFILNHPFTIIGGQGSVTAGGESIRNGCQVRIRLKSQAVEEDRSVTIQGNVEKLRFTPDGYEGKGFKFVVKSGYGVHVGLSAVQDCIDLGLATQDRTVSLGSKSYGYWKALVENYQDEERFQPFIEALNKLKEV